MRVYITGYNGFLGQAVCKSLTKKGADVRCLGRAVANPTCEHSMMDLEDLSSVESISDLPPPDVFIHLAARIGWPDVDLNDLYRPNVLATGLLANATALWGARMIFASAAIVHGVRQTHIDHSTPLAPDTSYGQSKALGEALIGASGTDHCLLRLGGVFGLNGPRHLGLNRALDGALQGERPTINAAGPALRNYIHVNDAAAAVVAAANGKMSGAHLIAGSPPRSLDDMLQAVCDRYLPGQSPERQEGGIPLDQVIVPSTDFPTSRTFEDVLASLNSETQ